MTRRSRKPSGRRKRQPPERHGGRRKADVTEGGVSEGLAPAGSSARSLLDPGRRWMRERVPLATPVSRESERAGPAMAPERLDACDGLGWSWGTQAMRPRGPIPGCADAVCPAPLHTLSHRARADTDSFPEGLRRVLAHGDPRSLLGDPASRTHSFVNVHSVPQGQPKLQQLQLPRSGPNG